eukprot:8256019-Karenia_brevis.AAC.1
MEKLEANKILDIQSLEDELNSKVAAIDSYVEESKRVVRGIAESLNSFGYGRGDVAELFSPPRIAAQAQSVGLRP